MKKIVFDIHTVSSSETKQESFEGGPTIDQIRYVWYTPKQRQRRYRTLSVLWVAQINFDSFRFDKDSKPDWILQKVSGPVEAYRREKREFPILGLLNTPVYTQERSAEGVAGFLRPMESYSCAWICFAGPGSAHFRLCWGWSDVGTFSIHLEKGRKNEPKIIFGS